MNISIDETTESKDCRRICDWLREFNWSRNPGMMRMISDPHSQISLNLIAKRDGEVIGGLLASTQAKWLKIEIMAVPEKHRGQGIGTTLIDEAIKIGRSRGCWYAFVGTLSHQAPEFYERLGFDMVGLIEDWDSNGNAKHFFKRRI